MKLISRQLITNISSLLSLFLSCNVYAYQPPSPLPQNLMYNNKPIDPLCIFESDSGKTTSLAECGINAQPSRQISNQQSALATKGFIGYEYSWPIEENNGLPNCYSYYKLIGDINGAHVIYALNNSGGSGQFSGIYLVTRQDDNITVKDLAGGDRCNNGINSVKIKNNKVIFNANLTATDFFELTKQKLKDYQGLTSCAACCIATGNFELDLAQNDAKLISIELEKKVTNDFESPHSPQYCFNKLLKEYVDQGHYSLDPDALLAFVKKFNRICAQ